MSAKKAPLPSVLKFAQGGAEHREQVRSNPAPEVPAKPTEPGQKRGGRPRSFKEPSERIPIMLPSTLVQELRQKAVVLKRTPSQIVADLLVAHLAEVAQ